MADSKVSALTADTSPTSDDLLYVVNDPGGTPGSKKATAANVITKAHGLSDGAVVSVVSGVLASNQVTSSAAELNILDGATLSTAELNYVDGVTSAIQTQLDAKQPLDAQLTDVAGLTPTDNGVIIGNGTNFVVESGATLKTSLGLTIGTDVQAYDADLTTWAGITPGTGIGTALAVNVGTDGAPVIKGGALGTPSSGTLTNATGLPIAGLVASTSTAIGVGSVELGHATDTTISRVSAGVIAVEGVTVDTASNTLTLTNKRITPRTGTTTSSATPTINTDNVDMYLITAQTVDITSFTTNLSGTPTEGQKLWISITGTAARAITWGSSFEASTVALPTTTVSTNRLDVGFVWNSTTSKFRCVAVA